MTTAEVTIILTKRINNPNPMPEKVSRPFLRPDITTIITMMATEIVNRTAQLGG
jgi:hypothetical protein